jgi:hypothetical protein
VSARNRELMALVPASLLLTAGFAAIFIQESDTLSDVTPTRTCSRSSRCSRASASS